jgi:hypothetical protein
MAIAAIEVWTAKADLFLIADGPGAALSPGLSAIVGGAVLYMLVKHPRPPARWHRQHIILAAAVVVPVTAASG